jgi:hypothetical protein
MFAYESQADIAASLSNVRFASNGGHQVRLKQLWQLRDIRRDPPRLWAGRYRLRGFNLLYAGIIKRRGAFGLSYPAAPRDRTACVYSELPRPQPGVSVCWPIQRIELQRE